MNQDFSVSAFTPEFSFENRNLRLSTNESNTQLSWVNERGTALLSIVDKDGNPMNIKGYIVGTAVINSYLILFVAEGGTEDYPAPDKIYRLKFKDENKTVMEGILLYSGYYLYFNKSRPLETLVSYETDSIQKVYWTDGEYQPRCINIVKENYTHGTSDSTYNPFDFTPELKLREQVFVEKIFGMGTFAPGVIQYAFTYYNKYMQETNIIHTTPLYYVSHIDRGGSPEDKIANAFKITVIDCDLNFDYLRIYSIQRTSLDATPICKRVTDVSLSNLPSIEDVATFPSDAEQSTNLKEGFIISNPIVYENDVPLSNPTEVFKWVSAASSDGSISYWEAHKLNHPNIFIEANLIGDPNHDKIYISWGTKEKYPNSTLAIIPIESSTNNEESQYRIVEFPQTTTLLGAEKKNLYRPMSYSYEVKYKKYARISYIDTGTVGDIVDPTELLYKGGEQISAKTLEQKDGTLFLGNIAITRPVIDNTLISDISIRTGTRNMMLNITSNAPYLYGNQLSAYSDRKFRSTKISVTQNCAGFKRGDTYRLGVQFQYKNGKWSSPVYLKDVVQDQVPSFDNTDKITLPAFTGTLNSTLVGKLLDLGYVRVRPLVVYPEPQDRKTICQCIPCVTMYTTKHRNTDKDLYAQSSWFFRVLPHSLDIAGDKSEITYNISTGAVRPSCPSTVTESEHTPIPYTSYSNDYNPSKIRQVEIEGNYDDDNQFRPDLYFVTLHSPDIECDLFGTTYDLYNASFRRAGHVTVNYTLSDIDIQTETPTISQQGGGFVHKSFSSYRMYGIVAGLFYDDYLVDDGGTGNKEFKAYSEQKSAIKYLVYPWSATGSLNNDVTRPANAGTASAILKKKTISNLRITNSEYYQSNKSYNASIKFAIYPQLFSSNETSIIKTIDGSIYMGNINTSIVPDEVGGKYFGSNNGDITYTETNVGGVTARKWDLPYLSSNNETSFTCPINLRTDGKIESNKHCLQVYRENAWQKMENIVYENTANDIGDSYIELQIKKSPVRMTYKSTPHLVAKLSEIVFMNPYNQDKQYNNQLPILDVVRELDEDTIFGGKSEDALRANTWIPCGSPQRLIQNTSCSIAYTWGDTYFQRYDCLKTYPFTKEDLNQIVEIGSFMLETHINMDGRYDRNRGQINNLNMSPQNFNLINPVYSQLNNFFTYKIVADEDKFIQYPNQITWTKTKNSSAEIDAWTNITLASTLELDGDKGEIQALKRFGEQLISFQDTGISQILYNENVQISSTQGVPIEIANSEKVQGKRYLSNNIGCSNKWSITESPSGIYFIDSYNKQICLFNGELASITTTQGFNTWAKNNIPSPEVKWTPHEFKNFRSYYDALNQEVLFVKHDEALAFSEKFNTFTSFYDYGGAQYFNIINDVGIWLTSYHEIYYHGGDTDTEPWDEDVNYTYIWKHHAGEYCKFFDAPKPYYMVLIGNPEPQLDKTFTNIEFRANVDEDVEREINTNGTQFTGRVIPYLPFDSLEVWNEYQHGITKLVYRTGYSSILHHVDEKVNFKTVNVSVLKKKFRIWRNDIPRDNYPVDKETETKKGIYRITKHPMDRMRNPWIYLKLMKEENTNRRTEIHDIVMTYYV